jgi:hypothetical protein
VHLQLRAGAGPSTKADKPKPLRKWLGKLDAFAERLEARPSFGPRWPSPVSPAAHLEAFVQLPRPGGKEVGVGDKRSRAYCLPRTRLLVALRSILLPEPPVHCWLGVDRTKKTGEEARLSELPLAANTLRPFPGGPSRDEGTEPGTKVLRDSKASPRVPETANLYRKVQAGLSSEPRKECLHYPLLSLKVPVATPGLSCDRGPKARCRTGRGNEDGSSRSPRPWQAQGLTHRPPGGRLKGLGPVDRAADGGDGRFVVVKLLVRSPRKDPGRVTWRPTDGIISVASRSCERLESPGVYPGEHGERERRAHRTPPPRHPLKNGASLAGVTPEGVRRHSEASLGKGNIRRTDAARVSETVNDCLHRVERQAIRRLGQVQGTVQPIAAVAAKPRWARVGVATRHDPMAWSQKVRRAANPVSLDEGQGVWYAHDPRLHTGRPQDCHPRPGPATDWVGCALMAKDEDPEGANTQRKASLLSRYARTLGAIRRNPVQEADRACKTRTAETVLGKGRHLIVSSPFTEGLDAGVMEVAIDPAASAGALVAGRSGTGEGRDARSAISCCDLHEVPNVANRPVRCGKRCATRPDGLAGRRLTLCARCERQSASHPGEREAVRGSETRQTHQFHLEPFLNGCGVHWYVPERGLTDGVGQFLQLAGTEQPPPGGDGLFVPTMKEPAHPQRIPSSVDQTTPAGCPNLLEFWGIAPAVSFRTCTRFISGGRARRLRREALYKRW